MCSAGPEWPFYGTKNSGEGWWTRLHDDVSVLNAPQLRTLKMMMMANCVMHILSQLQKQ